MTVQQVTLNAKADGVDTDTGQIFVWREGILFFCESWMLMYPFLCILLSRINITNLKRVFY
jgi:hypothetical protein